MKRLICAATVVLFGLSATTGLHAQTSTPKAKAGMQKTGMQTTGGAKGKNMMRAGGGCNSRAAQMSGKPC
jgi:hypothetical protein